MLIRHYNLFSDYGKSLIRIFKSPAYTLLTLSSVIGVLGGSGTLAFTPKYFASQYSLPLWKANMIIGNTCTIELWESLRFVLFYIKRIDVQFK